MLGGETVERVASSEQLGRVHTAPHLELLRSLDRPVLLEPNTIASETSWAAVQLAAGIALEAVDRGGFALVRPPGHHALAGEAYGFCLVNNIAVAARYAQAEFALARVAIIDYDVHHGNGTDAIFRGDDSVLYASIHQYGTVFPGTGGPGSSDETTVNVPLAAGSGDAEWLAAFDEIVAPAIEAFAPELLLVSAGFDAHEEEEIYRVDMRVTDAGFNQLSRRCAVLAPRLAAVLEGGYNLATLPRLVTAALGGFTGS